nr:MAG TPA: hypothetical protein [Caudoviricetes sp.]
MSSFNLTIPLWVALSHSPTDEAPIVLVTFNACLLTAYLIFYI